MMVPELKLIIRAGSGVNTIDVEAATTRGVLVANCPGRNAIAVAELTIGLMISLDRRIPENVADLRAGRWNKKEYAKARGLYGATLGVLGAGNIGREVIVRAAAFGMKVVLWSRRFNGEDRALTAAEATALRPRRGESPDDDRGGALAGRRRRARGRPDHPPAARPGHPAARQRRRARAPAARRVADQHRAR